MTPSRPVVEGEAQFEGAVELLTDDRGTTPLRLAASLFPFLPPALRFVVSCASGMRIGFVTDSTSVALEVDQLNLAPIAGVPTHNPSSTTWSSTAN